MFRTLSDPPSWWESSLPPELLRLPWELARVDGLLDDPTFFAPFAPYFHPVSVRPSTPVECCRRLMFLKFRYRLVYESLCAEVSDPGLLAAALPDRPGREGAAPDDADEADHPVRGGGGGRAVDTRPGLRHRVRQAPAALRVPRRAGHRDRRRRQHGLLRRALRHRRPDRPQPARTCAARSPAPARSSAVSCTRCRSSSPSTGRRCWSRSR